MEALLKSIQRFKRGKVGALVKDRITQFRNAGISNQEIFSELCFCILTANYSAEGGIRIQNALGNKFHKLTEKKLAQQLKKLGHRFPNMRARFIFHAGKQKGELEGRLRACDPKQMREWLAENVYGIGYKEAGHFLRNIGITNLAIIDFHILDILARNKLIKQQKNKTLSKKKYLEIERVLEDLAKKAKITLAELDLYLWYMETGKVLK